MDDSLRKLSNDFGISPNSPVSILEGKLDDIERISNSCDEAAMIAYAQDIVTELIARWPEGVPFQIQDFGDSAKFFLFIKVIFEKEFPSYKSGRSTEESEVLSSLKRRLLDAIKSTDELSKDLTAMILNYCLRVLKKSFENESSLQPTRAVVKTLESKHPYDDNMDETWPLSIPGAKWLKIVFDPKSSSEKDCDYVDIFKTAAKDEKWGGKFTGRARASDATWPGVGSTSFCRVDADNCIVAFHSGTSNGHLIHTIQAHNCDLPFVALAARG